MTNPYFPLLIMAAAALVLALGGLGASAILGPTKKSKTKADNSLPGSLLPGRHDVHHLRH